MRILRLDLGLDSGTVDFHPFVSIVHGLDEVKREGLINSLRGIVGGTTADLSGLVENNGELIELATANGEVLGPFTTEDVVMAVDAAQLGEHNEAALRAELDQLNRKAESDAVHVEEIRADLDPTALIRVQRLRQQLAGTAPVTAVELLRESNAQAIQAALDSIVGVPPMVYEAKAEISGIIARLREYEQAQSEAKLHIARLNRKVKDAQSDHLRASDALADAGERAVPRTLTPEEDARVEELAEIGFDRRGRRSKKRTEVDEAELMTLLRKVGQTTHAAYAMYRLSPTADPRGLADVERAQKALERATYSLQTAKNSSTNDPTILELSAQHSNLKDEARVHLGPMLPSDLATALMGLRDESENPVWVEGITKVYDTLKAAGAPVEVEIDPTELAAWAAKWLQNDLSDQASERSSIDRTGLEADLQQAEASLDRHARAMARIDRIEADANRSASYVREVQERLAIASGQGGLSKVDLLATIAPLADRVRTEAGSAAPLVLVGEFNTLADFELEELLGELEVLAQGVQLIVVTDREKAATWASQVGLRRALRSTIVRMSA